MKKVTIYTDGACSGNPGPGGWGAVLMYGQAKKEISGAKKETTNNEMEITAVLEALKILKEPCEVDVYSDSAYVVNTFEKGWIDNWVKSGWKTASKDPVKNVELWKELLELMKKHNVTFHKVKGHSDNEYNNRCDYLATSAIKNIE
jgi:ribonuclease HI